MVPEVLSSRFENSLRILKMPLGCFMSEEIGRLGGSKNVRDAHFAAREMADRSSQEIYEFGPFRLEPAERKLSRDGVVVALTPKVFDMLVILVRNSNHLLEKDELIRSLWPDSFVEEGNLSNNVFWLRKALGNDHEYIETVPRRGYRFVGALRQLPNAEKLPSEPWEFQNPGPAHPSTVGPVTVVVPSAAAKMGSAAPSRRSGVMTRWAPVWLIGGIVVILLASGYWYLSRPLPPPRITAYTQLTHDGGDKTLAGTDGSRLYFTQMSPNLIAQVGINGGEIAPLSFPLQAAQVMLIDISPDGSNALLYTFEEGLGLTMYVAPILGGSARRLGGAVSFNNFSPDGSSVIYSDRNGDVFLVHIDGSDKRKLASAGTVASSFAWSPDGKVIRFDKQDGLWEMSSDGTRIHRLLPGWKGGAPCCGKWTQDGSLFLFLANHQIWALDERRNLFRRASRVPIQLTSGPIRWARALPGKNGKTLFAHGYTLRGELSRTDVKTGGSQPFLGGISAEFVSFSPDGKFVAYVAWPEGTLWKANRDGSNRLQLNQPPNYAANPRWSPDSKEIVYMAVSPDGRSLIRRISAVDGTRLWLESEETGDMHDANWSPDGAKILFGNGTLIKPETQDLRIADLNTRQVTVVPGSAGKWSPRWSPDGRYIAAQVHPPIGHLAVFDLKLQRWSDLLVNGDVQFPSFSRDGKFIYFLRCGKGQGVFRIPVRGGKEEPVADMSGWHLTGYVGCSMSLDPTDAPLVLRDMGTDDIYALTLERK